MEVTAMWDTRCYAKCFKIFPRFRNLINKINGVAARSAKKKITILNIIAKEGSEGIMNAKPKNMRSIVVPEMAAITVISLFAQSLYFIRNTPPIKKAKPNMIKAKPRIFK